MKILREEKHFLEVLYGDNVFNDILDEVEKLKENSNISFDNDYIKLGCDFVQLNAKELLDNGKPKLKLKTLISKSFGEAAICKYNILQ